MTIKDVTKYLSENGMEDAANKLISRTKDEWEQCESFSLSQSREMASRHNKVSAWLYEAFSWYSSPEGFDYWGSVYGKVVTMDEKQ